MQGLVCESAVLDATRLAGPHELAAALSNVENFPCTHALCDMKATIPSVDWYTLEERIVAWAARVLVKHNAASAAALKSWLLGGPAQACAPSSPRTDAWARGACPGLADLILKLVLRSACMH